MGKIDAVENQHRAMFAECARGGILQLFVQISGKDAENNGNQIKDSI